MEERLSSPKIRCALHRLLDEGQNVMSMQGASTCRSKKECESLGGQKIKVAEFSLLPRKVMS